MVVYSSLQGEVVQNFLYEYGIVAIEEPLLGVKRMLRKLNKDDPFVAQASQSLEG